MPKQRVTEDQYLAELNRQLQEDEDFEEGMEFLPAPDGSSGRAMSGYTMRGKFTNWNWIGIYARIAHRVADDFEI